MKKIISLCLAGLLLALMAWAEPATLTVQGVGIVNMAPDTATVTLGAREYAAEVAEAQAAVNARLDDIIQRLLTLGIAEEDIRTNSLYIYHQDYEETEAAYWAENAVDVKLSQVDRVGDVIDAAFEAGANLFNGVSFSASDSTQERQQAMGLAMQDAGQKAQVLSEAAGMKLGRMVSVQQDSVSVSPSFWDGSEGMMARAESAAGTAVRASQLQAYATVTVVYELAEAE